MEDILIGVGLDLGNTAAKFGELNRHIDGLDSGLSKASTKGSGFGSILGGLVSPVGLALGAFGGLVGVLKDGQDQADGWNAVMSQTDAVLKSTGLAAGVSKEQVMGLADSLSANGGLSTFADDAVASGENLLLTFTGIGKDVFPQTTQTMLDMSQAMGQDLKSSALQLGKALNDPTQGMTALTRVGVTFTDEQKKQVEAMQKAGDVAGAQKVILGELGKEFGGSALASTKSFGGQMTILTEAFHNGTQSIADKLMPAITTLMGGATQLMSGALSALPGVLDAIGTGINTVVSFVKPFVDTFVGGFQSFQVAGQGGIDVMGGIANGLYALHLDMFGDYVNSLATLVGGLVDAFSDFFADLQAGESVGQSFQDLFAELGPTIGTFVGSLIQIVGDALPGIIAKLGEWASAFIAWIGPMIPPFLQQLGVWAGQLLDWLVNTALPNVVQKLGEWGKAFVDWIGPQILPMLGALGSLLLDLGVWLIGTALPNIMLQMTKWGAAFIGWIGPMIPPLLVELGKLQLGLLNWVGTVALPAIISKLIEWGGAFLGFITKDVLPFLGAKLGEIWTAMTTWIGTTASNIWTEVQKVGKSIGDGIKKGFEDAWNAFKAWAAGLFEMLPDWMKSLIRGGSPAENFVPIGQSIAQGIGKGFMQGWGDVQSTMASSLGALSGMSIGSIGIPSIAGHSGAFHSSAVNSGGGGGGGSDQPIIIQLMLDGKVVSQVEASRQSSRVRMSSSMAV